MLYGIILLVIGALLVVNVFYPNINISFNVIWPSALILISLYNMFKNKVFNGGSIIMFYIGIYFLIANTGIYGDISALFLPILFIVIGLTIIVSEYENSKIKRASIKDKEGNLVYEAVFNSIKDKVTCKDFKGAKITSIFGEVDLDLSDIEIKGSSAVITINSVFGGSNLIMPKNCHVIMNSNSFLGGNENKCSLPTEKNAKTIIVNCSSVFGGTELK